MFKIEIKNEKTSFEEKLINKFNDLENNISINTSELIVDFFEVAKNLKILVKGERLGDLGVLKILSIYYFQIYAKILNHFLT
jgi:hypothetical protein